MTERERFFRWLSLYHSEEQSPEQLFLSYIQGVCRQGIRLFRSSMWLPTTHPELWGSQLVWKQGQAIEVYRRSHEIYQSDTFKNTPGEAVHKERRTLRWRLNGDELPYPLLYDVKEAGGTDYVIIPFHTDHPYEQPWITFATRERGGFSQQDIHRLEEYCALFAWKTRVLMTEQATRSLLGVYLGNNAANRVMQGQFRRGSGESLNAVISFCDLRGFTALGERYSAAELVGILDHYFECVAGPIEDAGGEILKFIGDAVLAVFPLSNSSFNNASFKNDEAEICARALQSAKQGLANLRCQSPKHIRDDLRLNAGVALHIGEVLYGNIGGRTRLDFTVIGSAVNETARIAGLCKTKGDILMTSAFAKNLSSSHIVALGDVALRGVKQPHSIYTTASCY